MQGIIIVWMQKLIYAPCSLSVQAGAPGTAASVPNPFISDFPSLGPQATNAAAFGLFEQGAGGGALNEAQAQAAQGGDLFSANNQADLFGGESAMLKAANGGDGDAATEVVAPGAAALPAAALAAGKSSTATPPPRPPPPATAANGAPRALSPTVGGASHGRPAAASATTAAAGSAPSKSAFDDLNDSIRMALGGSPSRPAPLAQQAVPPAQQPQQRMPPSGTPGMFTSNTEGTEQPMMAGGPIVGYGVPTQPQVPVGYGSPTKQPMSGDGNDQ